MQKLCSVCGKPNTSKNKHLCATCYNRQWRMRNKPRKRCSCGLDHIYAVHTAYAASKILGISPAGVLRAAHRGRIGKLIAGHWHFTQHDLDKERPRGRPRKDGSL